MVAAAHSVLLLGTAVRCVLACVPAALEPLESRREENNQEQNIVHWPSVLTEVSRRRNVVLILRCERADYVDTLVHVPTMTGHAAQNSCGKN